MHDFPLSLLDLNQMKMQNHYHHFQSKALLPISLRIKTTTTTNDSSNGDQHKYRECLKNHAASLGGHALDGCMEFMLSPTSAVSRPSSLACAACGCHRNFHRRIPLLNQQEENEDKEGELEDEDEEDPFGSSGPHMLMALSAGGRTTTTTNTTTTTPRKRFRTKFSKEQKEKMQELAVRLGCRMLKRDDGLVEEWCREIGVSKHVFKVWMHNNKNSFRIVNTNNSTDINDNHGVLPIQREMGDGDGNGNGNGNKGCGLISSPSSS